jgi:hypothetical protein
MSKIDELKTAVQSYREVVAQSYRDAVVTAQSQMPRRITIDVVNGVFKYGAVTFDPINDRLEIYDRRGSNPISFTANEGEKLLAALKELYE